MNDTQMILILNELIKNGDIDKNNLANAIKFLKELAIDSIYYFDESMPTEFEFDNYFSELELFLIDANNIGYGIGYSIDIVKNILGNIYSQKELAIVRYESLKELFAIASPKLFEVIAINNELLFEVTKENIVDMVNSQISIDKLPQLEKFFNLYANWNKYGGQIVIVANGDMVNTNLMNGELQTITIEELQQTVIECLGGAICYVEDAQTLIEFFIEVYL